MTPSAPLSSSSPSPGPRRLGFECYPFGLAPSRRAFLRNLAAAAGGLGAAAACGASGTEPAADPEPAGSPPSPENPVPPLPVFPDGGFPEGAVRIGFNENPLGPSPRALAAIAGSGLAGGHRYNDPAPARERIAAHHGTTADHILPGCGSTEFLQFLPWEFLRPGASSIVLPERTYGWCAGVAERIGAEVIRTPMGAEGATDVPAMRSAIRPDTRLVYLANPNNPTGAAVSRAEIVGLAEAVPEGGCLVVDEAYAEFLPEGEDSVEPALSGGPVLVARTFSKAYGMAGLRLGYLIGSGPVFERAEGIWWGDFGLNTAAAAACGPALADREHVAAYRRTVDEGLLQLRSGLAALGCPSWPHRAPFLMTDLGREALPVAWDLHRRNIHVQDGGNWGLPTFLRVSVGLASENDAFLAAAAEVLAA